MTEMNRPHDPPLGTDASGGFIRGLFSSFILYPAFSYLWFAGLFSLTGVWMQTLVLGWVSYELTGSAFLLAVFTTARLSPMFLGPIGGVLADRLNRVRFMMVVFFVMAIVSVGLALLSSFGRLEYWHIVVGGFLLGIGGAPLQPARVSMITDVVDRKDLTNAMAMNSVAFDITRVLGPAVGGILLDLLGVANALWISVIWYVVAIGSLVPIFNLKRSIEPTTGSPFRDVYDGFKLVFTNRAILLVLCVTFVVNGLAWPVYQAFMPIFAKDILNTGPDGLGFLQTASGIGALISAIALAYLGDVTYKGKIYIFGSGLLGVFLLVFALSESYLLSLVAMFTYGLVSSGFGVMQSTLLMTLSPPELRGRVMGMMIFFIGVLPLGTLVHGAIATLIGVPYATALAGGGLAVSMAAFFIWSPTLRKLS